VKKYVCLGLLLLGAQRVDAQSVFVRVNNASQLAYQTQASNVYLRNLNVFDSNALGCCYNYWIDTSTVEGRNIFAIMLEAIALQQGMWLALPPGYASGAVSYGGNW
jgi:hypothetical protein